MNITILTLFPQYFDSVLATSIIKRAIQSDAVAVEVVSIREYAQDKHKTTDEKPFGGGAGMVLKVEPIHLCLTALGKHRGTPNSHIMLTSAKGAVFTQAMAHSFATLKDLTIICGHYEGVDERVAQNLVDSEVRIGDYVLTGGEPAAAVILDAVTRLLPGVLGNAESIVEESHSVVGTLEFPQYTRPREYNGWEVPEVLISGDHAAIAEYQASKKKNT